MTAAAAARSILTELHDLMASRADILANVRKISRTTTESELTMKV